MRSETRANNITKTIQKYLWIHLEFSAWDYYHFEQEIESLCHIIHINDIHSLENLFDAFTSISLPLDVVQQMTIYCFNNNKVFLLLNNIHKLGHNKWDILDYYLRYLGQEYQHKNIKNTKEYSLNLLNITKKIEEQYTKGSEFRKYKDIAEWREKRITVFLSEYPLFRPKILLQKLSKFKYINIDLIDIWLWYINGEYKRNHLIKAKKYLFNLFHVTKKIEEAEKREKREKKIVKFMSEISFFKDILTQKILEFQYINPIQILFTLHNYQIKILRDDQESLPTYLSLLDLIYFYPQTQHKRLEESFIKFLLAQEQYWILLNCIDKFHQIKPIEVQETLFLKCKKIDFLLENIEAFKDLPDYNIKQVYIFHENLINRNFEKLFFNYQKLSNIIPIGRFKNLFFALAGIVWYDISIFEDSDLWTITKQQYDPIIPENIKKWISEDNKLLLKAKIKEETNTIDIIAFLAFKWWIKKELVPYEINKIIHRNPQQIYRLPLYNFKGPLLWLDFEFIISKIMEDKRDHTTFSCLSGFISSYVEYTSKNNQLYEKLITWIDWNQQKETEHFCNEIDYSRLSEDTQIKVLQNLYNIAKDDYYSDPYYYEENRYIGKIYYKFSHYVYSSILNLIPSFWKCFIFSCSEQISDSSEKKFNDLPF